MKLKNKKEICLVTGGAGFIGSHVVDELIKRGYKVIVLDDLSGGFKKNVNPKCVFIRGSILNDKLIDRIFKKYKINYIFHLAAYAAEGLSHFIRKFNYQNNLIGSINLINQAIKHKIKRFVYTSSIAVYGTNQLPMKESLEPKPEDPYGIAKLAVEKDLKAAYKMFGLEYTIFRPHNVYGERQNYSDPYRNVLGIFMNNILKHKPLTIFGDGKQTRAFTCVGDVAFYIAKSIEIKKAKNEIFNIGNDKFYTVLKLAKIIKRSMDSQVKIKFLPARREVTHAYPDHKKIKQVFKIKKMTDLESGIRKMAEWIKKQGAASPKKFKKIEIFKNMPSSWKKLS